MCRIAGIISQKLSENQRNELVTQMCNAMAKGGPDGQGLLTLAQHHLAFGHRRLALIDLSAQGKQPMPYQQTLWITFNGEIYNYQSLKTDLIAKGFSFSSNSDTEVILAGYKAYGTNFFNQLCGMFAFALFDEVANQTFLVRDGQGIKPLYYKIANQQLSFASEVKAFSAIDANAAANPNWQVYFLAFGFIPEPYTTLKDVFNLQKGHFLTWDHATQQAQITPFDNSYPQQQENNQANALSQTTNLLNQAVKRHLIADAPIGVFLSGGIDSSLLALIAAQESKQSITTVSINFNEKEFSEAAYQEIIVKQIKSKHISYTVTAQDFEQNIAQIFADMDQPTNDGINSWFVNKVAKETGLKAVLSGIGADELFGGYPSFKRTALITKLKRCPKFLLKLAQYLPNDKWQRVYYLSYNNPIGEYLFLRGFFSPRAIAQLLQIPLQQVQHLLANYALAPQLNNLSGKNRISWFETNVYMQNQLLKDTDYMSMAHGVEVRVPFLDKDLVKHALTLPQNLRFSEQAKSLLINAYPSLLPNAIWNRPKKGFTFPFQAWFKQYSPLQNAAHYQNNKAALKQLERFKANKLHWSKIFALYQVFNHAK